MPKLFQCLWISVSNQALLNIQNFFLGKCNIVLKFILPILTTSTNDNNVCNTFSSQEWKNLIIFKIVFYFSIKLKNSEEFYNIEKCFCISVWNIHEKIFSSFYICTWRILIILWDFKPSVLNSFNLFISGAIWLLKLVSFTTHKRIVL